ncbi:MAG: hypothetical protein ABI609_03850 [Acidobacteriota bacterium]
MIGILVAALLLTLAAQLLREVHLIFVDTTRETWEPEPRLAAVFLRRDVHAALGFASGAFGYSSDPLVLYAQDSAQVKYLFADRRIYRVLTDVFGSEISRQVVLQPAESWRWRALSSGLLEIEYVVAENTSRSLLAANPERLQASLRPRTTHLLIGQRLGRSGW